MKPQTTTFKLLSEKFERFVKAEGYGGKKKKSYMPAHVREFLLFLEKAMVYSIKKVAAKHLVAYFDYLHSRPNKRRTGFLSPISIGHHIFSVGLMFDYLLHSGQVKVIPATIPKFILAKGNVRNILSREEVSQLYSVCESKRDRCIIALAYGAGLRRDEMQALNLYDVFPSKGYLVVQQGKNTKRRTVPLADTVLNDLKAYLSEERYKYLNRKTPDSEVAFLINNHSRRMTGGSMNDRLKELINRTGNQKIVDKQITLHCLRHTITTHLLENGADTEFVAKFLGHTTLDSISLYASRQRRKIRLF